MLIPSPSHLANQRLVPPIEGSELPFPPQRLGMTGITLPALREDGPDGVELAMLAQQMVAAQRLRSEVPYPH